MPTSPIRFTCPALAVETTTCPSNPSIYVPAQTASPCTPPAAEGEVVALPHGGVEGIAIGDRVIFKANAGEEVRFEGQRLVPSGDLLAKYVHGDAIGD